MSLRRGERFLARRRRTCRAFIIRKQEISKIFREAGLVQILGLEKKLSLRSHYWIKMEMRGITSVGGARKTIREKIVTEIWLSVIFVTKEAIESMNAR